LLYARIKDIINDIFNKNWQKNSILLFSPASASFGKYKNFEDRGDKFRLLIENN